MRRKWPEEIYILQDEYLEAVNIARDPYASLALRLDYGGRAYVYGLVLSRLTGAKKYRQEGDRANEEAWKIAQEMPPVYAKDTPKVQLPRRIRFAPGKEKFKSVRALIKDLFELCHYATLRLNDDSLSVQARLDAAGTADAAARCIWLLTGDEAWYQTAMRIWKLKNILVGTMAKVIT